MIKNKGFYFLCFCSFILSGCWDVVDIEDRGFIIGSAIDIEEDEGGKQPEFTITNQMVIPAGIASMIQSGGSEEAYLNFTSKGKSIYNIQEEVAAISSKVPFFEHLTVLVISGDVAKK